VAVLNGTPITGLAADTKKQLTGEGYKDANVSTGNNSDHQRQQSVVLYDSGARLQALAVARILDVRTVQPLDAATRSVADRAGGKPAQVVVVVGGDKSP
jgi:hypothetical protein